MFGATVGVPSGDPVAYLLGKFAGVLKGFFGAASGTERYTTGVKELPLTRISVFKKSQTSL